VETTFSLFCLFVSIKEKFYNTDFRTALFLPISEIVHF